MAGIAACALLVGAMHFQHYLYRNPAHRVRQPATTGKRIRQGGIALAGLVTGTIAFRPDHYDPAAAALSLAFAILMLVMASTDFERRLIPNRIVYPAIALAVVLCWAWPDRSAVDIAYGGLAAVTIGGGLFALGLLVGGVLGVRATPFGLGDVKLLILAGFLVGWPAFTSALVFGIVAAGIPALGMVALGRGRQAFAYGPYLVLGALIPLLWPASYV